MPEAENNTAGFTFLSVRSTLTESSLDRQLLRYQMICRCDGVFFFGRSLYAAVLQVLFLILFSPVPFRIFIVAFVLWFFLLLLFLNRACSELSKFPRPLRVPTFCTILHRHSGSAIPRLGRYLNAQTDQTSNASLQQCQCSTHERW